jgi:hypothetical protein
MTEFFPLLKRLGHKGISITHVAFDRAGEASLARKREQLHEAYFKSMKPDDPDELDDWHLSYLLDWLVHTGCTLHDVHNGFKWAMKRWMTDDILSDTYIAVESLRNSCMYIYGHLYWFLAVHVTFVEDEDVESVKDFWRALGLAADEVDNISEINPWWHEGRLTVSSKLERDPDIMTKIGVACMLIFRWQRFNCARWASVRTSCALLVMSLAIGLRALVQAVRANKACSDYKLHGFGKLDSVVVKFVVRAAISWVP